MDTLPTELIGSLPRPEGLLSALQAGGRQSDTSELEKQLDDAVRMTVEELAATGSPVLGDGEIGKYPDFLSYPLQTSHSLAGEGFELPFAANPAYKLPSLTNDGFRYHHYADECLQRVRRFTDLPVKQAVISPSLLSLLYPARPLANYSRDTFMEQLLEEHVTEIRRCLDSGAHKVQIDFVDAHLATRLDSSGQLLNSFIILLNLALDCFSAAEQSRIGIYIGAPSYWTLPDSGDIDDTAVLSGLLELPVGSFYIPLANRPESEQLLGLLRNNLKQTQRVFIGVTDPISPDIETTEQVCETIMQAAQYISPEQLGTTDNCGFAPFADRPYCDRETALVKTRARIEGTEAASRNLNGDSNLD